jgi:toxin ParE1/3/4
MQLLAGSSTAWTTTPGDREGARSLVIERWLALYRIVEEGVQVVRIVDGARDLTKLEWTTE